MAIATLLTPANVTIFLRGAQIVCALTAFIISLTSVTSYGAAGLSICAAWASGIPLFITAIHLVFLRRPLELVGLSVTLDVLGGISALAAFGFLCGTLYWVEVKFIVGAVFAICAVAAYAATAMRVILLWRRRFARMNPSDPLKPYLMKKEIDVWCYPVQNEQGQLFMDYEPVQSSGASKAPSEHSTRARSVRSFVRVDDTAPAEDQPANPARPQSTVDTVKTTAGWSVPSQNETLPRSEHASTILPPYSAQRGSRRPAVV